jgi:hypothetical protein
MNFIKANFEAFTKPATGPYLEVDEFSPEHE